MFNTEKEKEKFTEFWSKLAKNNWLWPLANTNKEYILGKDNTTKLEKLAISYGELYINAFNYWNEANVADVRNGVLSMSDFFRRIGV